MSRNCRPFFSFAAIEKEHNQEANNARGLAIVREFLQAQHRQRLPHSNMLIICGSTPHHSLMYYAYLMNLLEIPRSLFHRIPRNLGICIPHSSSRGPMSPYAQRRKRKELQMSVATQHRLASSLLRRENQEKAHLSISSLTRNLTSNAEAAAQGPSFAMDLAAFRTHGSRGSFHNGSVLAGTRGFRETPYSARQHQLPDLVI